jgi:hypothetical protein
MTRRRLLAAASVVTCLLAARGARAEAPGDFDKGRKYFSVHAAFQNERTGADTCFATAVSGFGLFVADRALVEVQFPGYFAHDDEDGVGLGFNALGRYYFFTPGRVGIYGEIVGGALLTTQDFPTDGTCLNFTYAGGPGASYKLDDGLFLIAGGRFQHVSNGFVNGRDNNPILNSVGGYVGLMWRW